MKFPAFSAILLSAATATAQPVEVSAVQPQKAAQTSEFLLPGKTEAEESASIFTRATGIITARNADIGDGVKAGDVLATVGVPDIDRSLDAAKAAVEQAAAREKNTRSMEERSARLLTGRAISREEAEQRATDLTAAAAALRLAQAELAKLEIERDFATVRAPFDGVITNRNFDRGDRTRGDSAAAGDWLYQISRTNTLRFVVAAPPDLALRLTPETKAAIRFAELPGKEFSAPLARSSRVFDNITGTMRVEFRLENKDLAIPAGLTGTATFTLRPPHGTFLLPNNAITLRSGRPTVMLVRNGKARLLPVTTGKNTGKMMEATSADLDSSTKVIVNANAMLKDGDPVKIRPSENPLPKP